MLEKLVEVPFLLINKVFVAVNQGITIYHWLEKEEKNHLSILYEHKIATQTKLLTGGYNNLTESFEVLRRVRSFLTNLDKV